MPIDLQLLLGGVLLGTLAGVWGGRRCAMRPGSFSARVLHVAIAFLLACPPYFLAYLILICFADGSGTMLRLPFVSGVIDYTPPARTHCASWRRCGCHGCCARSRSRRACCG